MKVAALLQVFLFSKTNNFSTIIWNFYKIIQAPASAPDMPDQEPKILGMEEERLQRTFLKQQDAAYSHEVDNRLPNGAAY